MADCGISDRSLGARIQRRFDSYPDTPMGFAGESMCLPAAALREATRKAERVAKQMTTYVGITERCVVRSGGSKRLYEGDHATLCFEDRVA
jgi:hypothetical protein